MGYVSKWTGKQLDRSVHHAVKISKTADYNVGVDDSGKIIELASSATANATFTLPSVGLNEDGYIWGFINRSSYVLTISTSDADTIHKGSSSITLNQHEMATLRYDHNNTNFDLISEASHVSGDIDADTIDFNAEYDYGVVTADITIDWTNGNNQKVTLGADITLTFSNMSIGHKQLKVVQDGTGGRIPTLPPGKWPGGTSAVFSTGGSAEDILSIYYDATDYYYQLTKGWS